MIVMIYADIISKQIYSYFANILCEWTMIIMFYSDSLVYANNRMTFCGHFLQMDVNIAIIFVDNLHKQIK